MAEEVVVKDNLSEQMISAGAELTRLLDERRWALSASVWLYIPHLNKWRLILAPADIVVQGPKELYRQLNETLSSADKPAIALEDIALVEPDHPLLALLRTAIRTGDAVSGIRFTKNAINGQFIEDAYIYRMK